MQNNSEIAARLTCIRSSFFARRVYIRKVLARRVRISEADSSPSGEQELVLSIYHREFDFAATARGGL